jgi:hypothetical protein
LLCCGIGCLSSTPACGTYVTQSIGALAGLLLIAGLWTPIAGVVVAIVEARIAFTSHANASIPLLLAVLGATLAMIGPGTWSIDACVFGRKHICASRPLGNRDSPKSRISNSNDPAMPPHDQMGFFSRTSGFRIEIEGQRMALKTLNAADGRRCPKE